MYKKRLLTDIVFNKRFGSQMRFITGPRQSGKTTLSKEFLKLNKCSDLYFNWDIRNIRNEFYEDSQFYMKKYYAKKTVKKKKWMCFDEIHKMPKWKNILKEAYDVNKEKLNFIITGSAKLDMFRRAGDSLAGRYFIFKLFPFSLYELTCKKSIKINKITENPIEFIEEKITGKNNISRDIFENLFKFSGFPEPYLKADELFHKKWHDNYIDSLVREDLRDLSRIPELDRIAHLIKILPQRISAPLSLNSLRQELEVSHTAVKNWMKYLNLIYLIFPVYPYWKNVSRAVKKEYKVYFYDWTYIKDISSKFENFVAVELKTVFELLNEIQTDNFNLYYLRTKDGKETDFVVTRNDKPWILFEVKMSHTNISAHNYKHSKIFGDIPLVQIVYKKDVLIKKQKNIFIVSADRFFSA